LRKNTRDGPRSTRKSLRKEENKMFKRIGSRKFIGLMLFIIFAWVAFFVVSGKVAKDGEVQPLVPMFIAVVSTQLMLTMAYIGGNVWQKFIELKKGNPTPTMAGRLGRKG